MKKTDPRTKVAQMLLKSSMAEKEKQKILFALPKMGDEEVKNLHKELKKLERDEKKRISMKLDAELSKEEKKEQELQALSRQMGATPIAASSVPTEEENQITNEMLQQISQDPAKLTALLIAMGPKEIKRLEKSVQRLGADPHYNFAQKDLKDTIKKLQGFSVDVYQAGQQLDEEFQKKQLIEQIRLEKEKQAVIQECMDDLDHIAQTNQK